MAPWVLFTIVVVVLAANHLSQLHRALHDAHSTSDHTVFELNVRRTLAGEQRVGPYSQGFYHPGPAYFYWLAAPYALLGKSTFSLYAAAQSLTLVFLLGIFFVVTRWSPSVLPAVFAAPFAALQMAYLGDYPLFDFWPPYVLFFGYGLFLLLCAGVAAGHSGALWSVALVGSFLVQTHVSYAPAVVVAALFALAASRRSSLRADRSSIRRHVLLSIAVLVAVWAVPAYAELFEGQKNTARIYRTFFEQAPNDWNIDRLLDRIALEFTGLWQFAFFRDRFIVPEAPKHYAQARVLALVVLALLVVGWRRARRRDDAFIAALCPLTGLSLLAATYSLTQVRGHVAPHHTAWISMIGFLAALAVVGGVFPPPTPHAAPRRPLFRLLGVTTAYAALSFAWPIRIIPSIHANTDVGRLADAVTAVLDRTPADRVRISWDEVPRRGQDPPDALIWALPVMLELEKKNVPFSTGPNPHLRWMLGARRWETPEEGIPEIRFVAGPSAARAVQCVDRPANLFLPRPVCVLWVTETTEVVP